MPNLLETILPNASESLESVAESLKTMQQKRLNLILDYVDEQVKVTDALLSIKSPQDLFEVHESLVKGAHQRATAQIEELTELVLSSQRKAVDAISEQFQDA